MRNPCVLIFAAVVALGGCAAHVGRPSGPVAVPQPLQELSPPVTVASDGKLVVEGPVVDGGPGRGLNVAASVHRLFLQLGIPSEVTCLAGPAAQSRVQIAFPAGLTAEQQSEVREVLALLLR